MVTAPDTRRRMTSRRAVELVAEHRSFHSEVRRQIDRGLGGISSKMIDAHLKWTPEDERGIYAELPANPIHRVRLADPLVKHMLASSAVVGSAWRWWDAGSRQIVRIDPELVEALVRTPGDVVLPGNPFDQLPFDAFVVVFDEPVQLSEVQRCDGVLVTRRPGLPTAPDANVLLVSLEISARQADARHVRSSVSDAIVTVGASHGEAHLYLYQDVGGRTIDEAIATTMERVNSVMHEDEETAFVEMAALVRVAIPTLLFLSSNDPDLEFVEPSPAAAKKARRAGDGTPPRVHLAGFRVGAAIRAHRTRSRIEGESDGSGEGRSVAPHLRRGHWHTVAYGPRHSQRRLQWYPPIPVNADRPDPGVPTVRPARRSSPDRR